MKTTYSRWDRDTEVKDSIAISGRVVGRLVVPRSELHELTLSGVQEMPPSAFLSPGVTREGTRARQNPVRLGNYDWAKQVRALHGPLHPIRLHRALKREPNPLLLDPREVAVLTFMRPNGFINLGLHFILDRIFNINTPDTAMDSMGLSNDTTTVIATTLLIDPTAGAGSPDFQALGAGVGAAATSRTGNTVTCSSGWEPGDFTTVFSITKVGLSTNAADSGDDTVPTVQGVVNIIGGTGGAAPYNEPFTVDPTNFTDFDLTFQQQITAQAT